MAFQAPPGSGSGSSFNTGFPYLNYPFGDTAYTKVFVGGLAWETQSETMRRYFQQFGEILEAVVICDKNTGRSKGYGFVTFRDPESARRACADPTPVIDGRRANCNLASLRRPRSAPSDERLRPTPYFGAVQSGPRGAYVGSTTYHQSVPYGYQQGFAYPPYGYTAYGPEYLYPQSVYNPYVGQQFLQVYGMPGTVDTAVYPFRPLGQYLPGGPSYSAMPGYAMPGPQFLQLSGPNTVTTTQLPVIPAPYPAGMAAAAVAGQPHLVIPAHSPQFTQGSGSDQTPG